MIEVSPKPDNEHKIPGLIVECGRFSLGFNLKANAIGQMIAKQVGKPGKSMTEIWQSAAMHFRN